MDLLNGLNSVQRKAVKTVSGPLLILAGAGSGKTRTLIYRIAYLISSQSVWPNEILAVTFTNKAAREMRSRLAELLNQNLDDRNFMTWMGTFHSVCVKLLKIDGKSIGIKPNFVIYDEDDRNGLVKQAMKQLSLNDEKIKPKAVSSLISSAKNKMVGPDEYQSSANMPFLKDVAKIYKKYESLRISAGALDFDDLLIETFRMLDEVPNIRKKWQSKFKHILIDEYQDTNTVQYNIVKLLVNENRNICVVGDDWQSIYSWRGADFTNILNFEKDFQGAKIVKLEENYRSTGNILESASNLISKNTQRTDKKLWTASGPGLPVQVHCLYNEAEEANLVAERISSHVAMKARNYGDFAVFYRTNAQSYTLERSFLHYHIPYQIIGGVRFYDRKEIKDVIAYLKLMYQPNDLVSFTRIVNTPVRGIGNVSLEKFLIYKSEINTDIIEALLKIEKNNSITKKTKDSLYNLGKNLHTIKSLISTESPSEIIEKIVSRTGYRDFLSDGTPKSEERIENIGSLISDAQNFASLEDFLNEVALMSSVDLKDDIEKVSLMTLHASKGLEFPIVFIVGLEEGILPHARVYESGPSELEEERRLMYVGMTRAREELHLTYAQSRVQFGSISYNQMSRFLNDVGDGVALTPYEEKIIRDDQEFFIENTFEVGDKVRSASFGIGEIIDVDGLAVTIQFSNGQTKKLNIEYARLQKI
ncbi:MAG TPA: UvrD-helicase domain-containing protein [Candidatus Saccharibacteria bacterium]|nr:UvrD-helicase domain-containing protein [Candidatus Saccharibacteria bacterium]